MAGFVILFEPDTTSQARAKDFHSLLQMTAHFKQLDLPAADAEGRYCTAAKLDAPSSIHRGIIRDEQTGSWLLVAGTLVALTGDNDPDTMLHALLQDYIDNGVKALERYDGHFALVIYNGREESLSVISDAMGFFSIFYGSRGNQIYVSISALAVARQIHSKPNTLMIEYFLRAGRVDGVKTLWLDVERLSPATVLKISRGKIEKVQYWAPQVDDMISRLSFNEALHQALDMLLRTFKGAIQREGKIWADLTGGFDTRLTTTLMTSVGIPFITYCVGEDDHPDVKLSKMMSQEMGWEYQHVRLSDNWDQEQYAWFETAVYRGDAYHEVRQMAKALWGHQQRSATYKVYVTGSGGENWRGYYWPGELFNLGKSRTINYEYILDEIFSPPIPVFVMSQNRTEQTRYKLKTSIEDLMSAYEGSPNSVKLDRYEIYRDTGLGGAYLSAAAGTARSLAPLCFKAPVSFAFSLNPRWKLPRHHLFVRALLEKINVRLAQFETTTGGPAIPIRLTNLHKFGPLWKKTVNGASIRISKRLFHKTITSGEPEFPSPALRKSWLKYAIADGLLASSKMQSGALYKADALEALVAQAWMDNFGYDRFLDRIITIEIAMRGTGASVD